MKIGIDIRMIGKKRTGDETVFSNLVKNLALIDLNNDYYLFTDVSEESKISEIKKSLAVENKKNFQVISLPTSSKFIWNFWTLPHYLRNNPLDVFHTQYITPFFISRKIRVITHIHDVSFLAFPELIKKSDLFFLKVLIPLSLNRADKIIAVSEFTKQEIIKYYRTAPEKIVVAYNGLGHDFLTASKLTPESREKLRKKYQLPEIFLLYVGTLQPRKNIPFLIESFSKIRFRLDGVKLVIAGNIHGNNVDPSIKKVVASLDISNNIVFPGYIDQEDLPGLYQLAQAFIYPSLYEGFGIPIIEAFSQQIPVLASDISIHQEIGGMGALYANPQDLEKFSKALYDISVDDDLRKSLWEAGTARLCLFSWENTAKIVVDTYQQISH